MKLAVIGSGNMGKSIGKWAGQAGYEVIFSAKNPEHARDAAKAAGKNSKSGTLAEAVKMADMVLLAVPHTAVKEILPEIKPFMKGKVLIDLTNPLNSDFTGLSLGFTTSAAEEIQKSLPDAKVVKAFNTVFASIFASQNPSLKGSKVAIFYASDDKEGKEKVAELITKMGLDAVDCGPLKASRDLEPLAFLNISLGYSQGHGTSIGFSFIR